MKLKSFTLIELLAVIVLLGIIAMLVYPSVNDALTDSKKMLLNYQSQVFLILLKVIMQILILPLILNMFTITEY